MNLFTQTLLRSTLLILCTVPGISFAKDWSDPNNQTIEPCVVAGVETFQSPMYEKTEDTAEIMQLERDLCWMIANNELSDLAGRLHQHGLLLLDGGDIIYGREQQMQLFTELLKIEGVLLTWEPIEAHVSDAKDMAWAIGLVKIKMPGEELQVAKYTSIWHKENGKWQNVLEMRNPFKR